MPYWRIDKVLLGWLALAVAQIVAGVLIKVKAATPPHALEWMLVTDFLIAIVLGVIAVRSDWVGWKLAAALAIIPLAIYSVNLVEGAVFLKNSAIPWRSIGFDTGLTYVLVLPMWRYIFGGGEAVPPHYSPLSKKSAVGIATRLAVSDVLYLFLYFTAGMIIFPYVRSFYATQVLPAPRTIVALQLLLRGPVFVLICLLLVRMLGLPRWRGALAVGLAFTLLSGVAPLLMPSPYWPDYVRWTHFAEVVSSNFVFGALMGLIWGKRQFAAPLQLSQAA